MKSEARNQDASETANREPGIRVEGRMKAEDHEK